MLSEQDMSILAERLADPALQVLTVVRMGKIDFDAGNLNSCMHRLRIDADKLSDDPLYAIIRKYFN